MNPFTRKQLILKAAARAEMVRKQCNIEKYSSVDPIGIAEQRGCEVRYMSLPSLEGVYSIMPRSAIIIGSERPAGRRAFTCAHELGHHEFGHGMRIDEMISGRSSKAVDPEEFLADMFAATLLMSQASVRHALKVRNFATEKIDPIQIFRLACFWGVGYSTLIDHMALTLRLLSQEKREGLKRVQPKDIKNQFGIKPQLELIFVDEFWHHRAVDLEVGDILVLPQGSIVENTSCVTPYSSIQELPSFKAIRRGYSRAHQGGSEWAINIRIATKKYEGLAQYRFLDDPEEVKA
jgi:Zn-dependent peptidase ImmA (M78 family)